MNEPEGGPEARPESRAAKRAATAQRILDAARAEFGERGLEAATIRRIAQRANVDPSLVMQHYGSKAALFAVAIQLDDARPGEVEAHLHDVLDVRLAALPPETRALVRSMLTAPGGGRVDERVPQRAGRQPEPRHGRRGRRPAGRAHRQQHPRAHHRPALPEARRVRAAPPTPTSPGWPGRGSPPESTPTGNLPRLPRRTARPLLIPGGRPPGDPTIGGLRPPSLR